MRPGRLRSYEEIVAEHAFPPRSRGRGPRYHGAQMASFTTFFMTEVSCLAGNFTERELLRCCARPVRRGCPFHRPRRTWSFCCEKELLKQVLEAMPQRYSRNFTGVPTWKLLEGRPHCKLIPQLPSMTLQMWLARLLQHGAQAARCVHGLADKLQETSEAAESVAFLAAELARKCPGRRTLLALRRNLMIWWDRNKFWTQWTEMEATFQKALLSVYKCQQKLPAVPVIHLHIPKTAGSSMKQWATLTGYKLHDHYDQTLDGDGAYWMGAPARLGNCKQRLWESHLNNASWFPVERWLDLPLCEEFQYVVTLREPVPRLLHQFHHFMSCFSKSQRLQVLQGQPSIEKFIPIRLMSLWNYEELKLRIPKQLQGNLTSQEAADAIRWPSDWLNLWLGMTSNYQVRSLAGAGDGKAYLEEGPKAARRLLGAKAVLEQLDVVLTAGAQGHDAADEMLLKEALRTPKSSESGFPFVSHTIFDDQKTSPFRFNPLKLSWPVALDLQQRNHADRLLLSYARRLRRLDRIYFRMVAQEKSQPFKGGLEVSILFEAGI